jgi:large subunit ribosomal protein L35
MFGGLFARVGSHPSTAFAPYRKERKRETMKQKLKTHKAMAKRVKISGSGKLLRRKVALNHLRRNKSPQAVRSMDKYFSLAPADTRHMKRLLPYGGL